MFDLEAAALEIAKLETFEARVDAANAAVNAAVVTGMDVDQYAFFAMINDAVRALAATASVVVEPARRPIPTLARRNPAPARVFTPHVISRETHAKRLRRWPQAGRRGQGRLRHAGHVLPDRAERGRRLRHLAPPLLRQPNDEAPPHRSLARVSAGLGRGHAGSRSGLSEATGLCPVWVTP